MMPFLESLRKALRLVVGKCIIEKSSKSSSGMVANIVLLGSERHSDVRLMQHYGFASRPVADSEAVALFVGGSRDNGVVVATQGAVGDIPALEPGEAAFFSKFGQKILLKSDGSVDVLAASGKTIHLKNDVQISGNLKTTGTADVAGDITTAGGVKAVGEVATKVQKSGNQYVEVPTVTVHLSTHAHNITSPGTPSGPPVG